jgi:regulator of protease activity HflC (stomatin/prohibitin superfamily)
MTEATPAPTPAPAPTSVPAEKPRGLAAFTQRLRAYADEHMLPLVLGGLIFTFVVIYLANRIFILVGSGEAGVLFRRLTNGTDTVNLRGEGIAIIAPWNKLFLYNVRVQEQATTVEALSTNGLMITVVVSVRYYPDYGKLGLLHQKIGPDYADKVVMPEVIAGVREIIGRYRPEELYTEKISAISDAIIQSVVRAVGEKFIVLDDVNIKSIKLPPLVTQAIEAKLQQEQLAQEYEFRLRREIEEAKRLDTQAKGLANYNRQVSETLSPELLRFKGIEATLELSKSTNSKVIVIGSGQDGLPLILNPDGPASKAP